MKTLAIALAAAAATIAIPASAQVYYRSYDYNPYYADAQRECWNPRARTFEQVRPGEYQEDLDMRHCRYVGDVIVERRVLTGSEECWNHRARQFEEVRRGEYQDDLDYRRCRVVTYR